MARKTRNRIAQNQEILDAAEIVIGPDYVDALPHEHAKNWDVRQELKRAGFRFMESTHNGIAVIVEL